MTYDNDAWKCVVFHMYVFPEFLFTLTLLFTFIRVTFINDPYSAVAFGDHDTSNRKYCSKNSHCFYLLDLALLFILSRGEDLVEAFEECGPPPYRLLSVRVSFVCVCVFRVLTYIFHSSINKSYYLLKWSDILLLSPSLLPRFCVIVYVSRRKDYIDKHSPAVFLP